MAHLNPGPSRVLYITPLKLAGSFLDLKNNNTCPNLRGGTQRDMVSEQVEFVKKLRSRNYSGLVIKDEIIREALHQTTFPIGFTRGVRWLFNKHDE